MLYFGSNRLKKMYLGSTKIKKAYLGATRVYSAGSTVTYYVDSSTSYTEEVDSDATCLSPTTFTPSKSGYTFLGWREDTTASSSVLSSKVMGDEAITLYAVFYKTITLTYYKSSSTASTATGKQYYNNGNIAYPVFTISSPSVSGWTFLGWISDSTSATGTVSYTSINSTTFSANATLYAKFSQTITLSYNGNSATGGSTNNQTGTRYWNAYGNYSNPSFTLRSNGFTRTGYSFSKWAQNSTSGTQYAAGASVTLSADATFYAIWTADVIKVYIQFVDTGDATKNYCKLTLTDTSTNSAIYTAYHYESSGTYWYSQISYAGVVAFNFTDSDDYPAAYYNPFFCATALTTLYSNTGLSTVGLAKGSYIEYNQNNGSGVTSATYYVSMVNVSI